jgi:hypothetical protein
MANKTLDAPSQNPITQEINAMLAKTIGIPTIAYMSALPDTCDEVGMRNIQGGIAFQGYGCI